MKKNKSLKNVTFFIILLTYQVLHGEGRQIKSLAKAIVNPNRIPSLETPHSMLGSTTSISFIEVKTVDTDAQGDSCLGVKCLHNFQTTTLGHSPGTGHSYLTSYRQGVESEKKAKTAKVDKRFLSNLPTPMKILRDSKVTYDDNFRPTPPGRSPGAGHPEIKDTETKQHNLDEKCRDGIRSIPGDRTEAGHFFITESETTNHQGNTIQAAHSHAGEKDDYPPTAPGRSPGTGHPEIKDTETKQHSLDEKCRDGIRSIAPGEGNTIEAAHSHAAEKDDYPPTAPGHSPGAGHPQTAHPHAMEKDDYPPTTPGHSPGAGHAILKN